MSDRLTPLEDARRERDEAQAREQAALTRATTAEQRLSDFTKRLSWAVVIVLAVLAMAGAGIVLAPKQVAGLLVGVP